MKATASGVKDDVLVVAGENLPANVSAYSVVKIFCSNALTDLITGTKFAAAILWAVIRYMYPLGLCIAEVSLYGIIFSLILSLFTTISNLKFCAFLFLVILGVMDFFFHMIVLSLPIEDWAKKLNQKVYQRVPFFKDKFCIPIYSMFLLWGMSSVKENVMQRLVEAKKQAQLEERR